MEQAQLSDEIRPYVLWAVAPGRVASLWNLVEEDVRRVTQRPGMRCEPMHFRQMLIEEQAQLFLMLEPTQPEEPPRYHGCVITRLLFGRNGERTLEVALAAGEDAQASTAGMLESLEEFARAEGCMAVEFVGRSGWAKLLPEEYRETGRIYTKEL